MPRYKNIGHSLWRRPTGEAVPPGGTFEATPREHQRIKRRGYHGRLQRVEDVPAASSSGSDKPTDQSPATSSAAKELRAEWTLRMEPAKYLKLHGSGGHAPLARQIVAAEEEGAS
ncbi:hypothetical protein LCGC14_0691800 [marine sediment metagenome]|uniref:Uncharacterized protein n=1 Tax=marine sediment metagenome TaxID=412755 RepID=A0A0F9T6G0_9ZZZZ